MNSADLAALLQDLQPRRILIIKPSALGDVVQTLPLLPVLKRVYPHAEIDWVIREQLAGLLEIVPGLTRRLIYERRGGARATLRLLHNLYRTEYDLVLDLQGLFRSAVMAIAAGGQVTLGLETAREGSRYTCHALVPGTSKETPAHARPAQLASLLGHEMPTGPLRLTFRTEDLAAVDQLIDSRNQPYVVLHPGAMWETKRWPPESFGKIAARISENLGFRVVVVGAPSETPLAAKIENVVRDIAPQVNVINCAGKTTLPQLAAVLQRAEFVVSNDSGPMHLAAALGIPVVGLFTCTSTVRSGPPGAQHELVQAQVPCAATYRKACPFTGGHHLRCLQALSLHQTWTAIDRLVAKHDLAQRAA